MMPSRPYGLGKYGRNTYDHWRLNEAWIPIPIDPPVDIWVPVPDSAVIPLPPDRWVPIVEPAPWG
jgi:hypothetical protein